MANPQFRTALVSCSEKSGLAEFLQPLQKAGLKIYSTGGTARYLQEKGVAVIEVSQLTGFPEVMDGRVKTLHPHVHMGLLARPDNDEDSSTLKKYGITPFDLVIGNLYPFESEPGIENIDIGGPSFLRAAAKNFARIAVICDPRDYDLVASNPHLSLSDRQYLAAKVFSHTAAYDSMIAKHFLAEKALETPEHALGDEFVQGLRYGENPQQKATWYKGRGHKFGLHQAQVLQGKELSYNNILDLEAATATLRDFNESPACVVVKHNNPCGVAINASPLVAVSNALAADKQSAFGGVVALNFKITADIAQLLNELFLECVIAPAIEDSAKQVFSKKKNLRVLFWPDISENLEQLSYRTVAGGFLVQTADQVARSWSSEWQVFGQVPDETTKKDLMLAWRTCAHLKSNAIAIASRGQTVGLGMGQVNRVDAVTQAISRMQNFHPGISSAVLASDAFFPFPDSIEKIAAAGIRYVIQPGGSIKDDEVKKKAFDVNVSLIFTGQRHFLH